MALQNIIKFVIDTGDINHLTRDTLLEYSETTVKYSRMVSIPAGRSCERVCRAMKRKWRSVVLIYYKFYIR